MKLASSPFSIAKTFFNTLPDLHDGYLVRLYDKRNRICDNSLAALRILKNNLTGRYDKALPSKKLTNALRPRRSSGAKKSYHHTTTSYTPLGHYIRMAQECRQHD
jgi:hypothetical protein